MNWKQLTVLVVAVLVGLIPGPARTCMTAPTEIDSLIYATTEHLTGGKNVPLSQKPSVPAVSLYEPYAMTSWVQGRTAGEYLFIASRDKWVFVGGGSAHYSADDLVRLFHVPRSTASALVDRFVRLHTWHRDSAHRN